MNQGAASNGENFGAIHFIITRFQPPLFFVFIMKSSLRSLKGKLISAAVLFTSRPLIRNNLNAL
jgi:hypothetical protein